MSARSSQTRQHDDHELWMGRARAVAELVSREAVAVEQAGTLTEPVLQALRDGEFFWAMFPTEFGGGQIDIVTALEVIEEISRADGSIGWSLMANMTGGAAACAYLPDRALETFFADGARPIFAGMLSPKGTATPVDGGFTISGQYQFGSGSAHADWVAGGVFVREGGKVVSRPSGEPDLRAFYVPRSGINMLGNWDVLGMEGTGSFDYEIVEQFVEADFGFQLPDPPATRPIPSFQLGLVPFGGAGHGAVALGVAVRAFEELTSIVYEKRRPGMPGVIDQQLFLHDYAEHEAALQAARAFFYGVFQAALDGAQDNGHVTSLQRQRLRQAVTYCTSVAADVVHWCYTWSGSNGLRNPSPLGRCLRDISAATQHMFVDPNTLVSVAPDLLADWKR
ncbi:MAG: Pigment production hydroxylase [Acidimicrobiia bacterium]|nr:Pigment production hydroxylase [Acidimicrobiia bacterium]